MGKIIGFLAQNRYIVENVGEWKYFIEKNVFCKNKDFFERKEKILAKRSEEAFF